MITFSDLAHLLSAHFGIDESMLRPDSTFEELEMDSLAIVETAVIVEEKFGVRVPEDVNGLALSTTLAEAAQFLNRSEAPVGPPVPAASAASIPEQVDGIQTPCGS